jgi:hypothetical protein
MIGIKMGACPPSFYFKIPDTAQQTDPTNTLQKSFKTTPSSWSADPLLDTYIFPCLPSPWPSSRLLEQHLVKVPYSCIAHKQCKQPDKHRQQDNAAVSSRTLTVAFADSSQLRDILRDLLDGINLST